jgi:hypothetical protein
MDNERFAKAIRDAGATVQKAERDLGYAEATEKRVAAQLMMTAEHAHGQKTVAAQTKWADEQDEMFNARVNRGTAKGALASAKANLLAAEVSFKTWQTEMATNRAEMRTLMG